MQLLILFTYSTVLVADVNESFFDEEAIRTALIDFTGNSDTDRRRALIVLVSAFNHENIKDVPLKQAMFVALLKKTKSAPLLYDSVTFLARLPEAKEVTEMARSLITSTKASEKEKTASLIYLVEYDRKAFATFFHNKRYLEIEKSVRTIFSMISELQELRDVFFKELISKMLHHKSIPFVMDAPCVEAQMILSEKKFFPDYINREKSEYMTSNLPLEIIWLLGEIGCFDSFEILLENYLSSTKCFRSANSLAACTGSRQVSNLFSVLNEKNALQQYLELVLKPDDWDNVKTMQPVQQEQYWLKHYERLRSFFLERAKPQQG
jgi:hypothetical protein